MVGLRSATFHHFSYFMGLMVRRGFLPYGLRLKTRIRAPSGFSLFEFCDHYNFLDSPNTARAQNWHPMTSSKKQLKRFLAYTSSRMCIEGLSDPLVEVLISKSPLILVYIFRVPIVHKKVSKST